MPTQQPSKREWDRLLGRLAEVEMRLKELNEKIKVPRPKEVMLSLNEASAYLSVGRTTLYKFMDEGQLGYVKIGGNRRIMLSELDRFLKEHTTDRLPCI